MSFSTRLRRRLERAEDGYIMLTTLGILILLVATSLLVIGATKAQVLTARENERFTNSRQAMEEGLSIAASILNKDEGRAALVLAGQPTGSTSTTDVGGRGAGVRGSWTWAYDPATRTVRSVGEFDSTDEERTLPLRWRGVGSQVPNSEGGITYGVTANGPDGFSGAWTSVLAASDGDSTVLGNFIGNPNVSAYGTAQIDLSTATTGDLSTVHYADDAEVSGVPRARLLGGGRSMLTASFDFNKSNERFEQATAPFCAGHPAASALSTGYGCAAGDFTVPSTGPGIGGLKTLVVDGDLTIPYDLDVNGQLHIYVAGKVTITRAGAASDVRRLRNVFIYAPNGTCSTATGVSVELTGSMACKKFALEGNNNSFSHVFPYADITAPGHPAAVGATRTTDVIFYTEHGGYVDSLTN